MSDNQRFGFLVSVGKDVTKVSLPEKSGGDDLNDLITAGEEGGYLITLFCDEDTDRTLFLLCDSYNDIPRGPVPKVNQWILDASGVTIYGDALFYLSQPEENDPGDEDTIFDLKIEIEDLIFLLELSGKESPSQQKTNKKRIEKGKEPIKRWFAPFLLVTDYQNKELRSKWLNTLSELGINNKYPSDSEGSE
jgi:hypothetical protein